MDFHTSDTDEPADEPANEPADEPTNQPAGIPAESPTAGGPTEAPTLPEADVTMVTIPLPSLDTEYNTAEEAITAINDFALDYGYAVVKRRSKKTKSKYGEGVLKKVQLACDRGGVYTSRVATADRKRKTASMVIGCPFDIAVRLRGDKWVLTVANDLHNHEPSLPTTHQAQRKLELQRKDEQIQGWFRLSHPTRQILTALANEDPKTCLIAKDINNARRASSQRFLAGRTPIQALLMEFPRDNKWMFR